MANCSVCNNTIKYRQTLEKEYMGMGVWERKKEQLPYCDYCEWKGTTSLGRQLRKFIHKMNEGR